MKKQYFYDYKTTAAPVDNSGSATAVEPTTIDVTPEPEPVQETELGHGEAIFEQPQSNIPETPSAMPEAQTGGFEPLPSEQRRSRLVTPVTAGLLIAVLVLGYLVYRNRPQTYQACANLPGSTISDTFPQTCRTIYGAIFQKDSFGSLASDMTDDSFVPTVEPDTQMDTSVATDGSVAGSTTEVTETTKGGLPVEDTTPEPTTTPTPTVAPTVVPTPAPTSAPVAASSDTVKHRYPRQGFSLMLPTNWSSSNATHDLQTNVTTMSMWDNDRNNPELRVTIQPNWDNTGDAQSQSINAEVAGVSAIKMSGGNETSWYFERDGKVYIFKCASHAAETCQDIVASMAF